MMAQILPPGLFHLLRFQGADARMNFQPGECGWVKEWLVAAAASKLRKNIFKKKVEK